jgi:hypothetical protein
MQLKLHSFESKGKRFMPSEIPSRLLRTGPKIILSNKKTAIFNNPFEKFGQKYINKICNSLILFRLFGLKQNYIQLIS